MQIDPEVERHVREAFSAVLDKDGDRMVAAFRGLDKDQSAKAVRYIAYVVGFIVNDVFRDGWTRQQIRDLASKIVAAEQDWVDLGGVETVAALLDSTAKGSIGSPSVPREDVVGTLVVCGAYLLGGFRLDGQNWYEYLDEIWNLALEIPDS